MTISTSAACETRRRDRIIVVGENRSQLRIMNDGGVEVVIVRVDGCEISSGQRCDYLIGIPNGTYIFLELKGGDVDHAICQLEATLRYFRLDGIVIEGVHAWVVSTQCPLATTKVQTTAKRFKQRYRATFRVCSTPHVHRIGT